MRRIRLALACLTVLLSGCNESLKDTPADSGQGVVYVSLTSESGNVVSKSSDLSDEDYLNSHLGDFTLEILNSGGICFYREKYADASDKAIPLNSGNYTLIAKYGNPLNAGFGNSTLFYKAEVPFEVRPQTRESIDAVARFAKVKVAVEYVNLLAIDDCDFYMDIEYGKEKRVVTFAKDETRHACVPEGIITPVFHYNMNGEWKMYRAQSLVGAPNDFITFKVDIDPDVNPNEGSASISATIDKGTELIEKTLEVEYIEFTGIGPTLDIISDSPGNTELRVYPGERAAKHKARVDALVPDRVERCILQIESPYLASIGVPAEVDLSDADDASRELLWEYGIRYFKDMKGRRLTYVDLEGYADHIAAMHYDPDNPKNANFKIIVEDMNGKSAESSFARFIEVKPEFTLDAMLTNVYASKVCEITATLQRGTGNPAALILDYRSDADPAFSDWKRAEMRHDVNLDTDTENVNLYADMSGLKPNTKYKMRLRYRNNDKLVQYFDFTTEAALQVGNAGFEDWSEESFRSKTIWCPWASSSDRWWDSNGKQTADESSTATHKAFPTVWYTEGRNGGRAASITAISHGALNSGFAGPYYNKTQGELFVGTYGGNRKHDFASRPSAMRFWYKYSPYETDTWQALVQIMNGTTVIGEGRITNSSYVSSWTECTVDITYSNTRMKANGVYIQFLQSTSSSPNVRFVEMATPQGTVNVGAGSQLTIDDVELIY